MAPPVVLSPEQIAEVSYERWNALVHIAFLPYEQLDNLQRIPHHALWYESEVNNGGHLQYFENHGTDRVPEAIESLKSLGALSQAAVLTDALTLRMSVKRKRILSLTQFLSAAKRDEYGELDSAFYQCEPGICELLQWFLDRNEASFIRVVAR